MYPWQAAALECGRHGSNLVYCAPTSGGKSLVAEILLIRRLSNTKRPGRPHGGFHVRHTCTDAGAAAGPMWCLPQVLSVWSKLRFWAVVVLPYISTFAEKTMLTV